MNRIIGLTCAVTMSLGPHSWARHSTADDSIRMVLPPSVDSGTCHLQYFLVGPFGGYGGFARPKVDASEFEIETVREGEDAQRLKIVLFCPGYQIVTIAFKSLPDLASRTVHVHPKPLGTIRFRGAVRGLTLQQVQVLHVDVDYTPWWICEFFNLPDCGLGAWKVASVELDTDGRFSATLPDFAGDATVRSFKNPGELAFRIRDQKTGNPLFDLKPTGSPSSSWGRIPVAASYPGVQTFDAELPR